MKLFCSLQLSVYSVAKFQVAGTQYIELLVDPGVEKVEGMEVKADEGGVTHTRGGYQWFILPAGCKDSSDQHMDVRSYLDLKLYGLDFTEHLQL